MVTLEELFEFTNESQSYVLCNASNGDELGRYDSKEDIPEEYKECFVMDQSAYHSELWVDLVLEEEN